MRVAEEVDLGAAPVAFPDGQSHTERPKAVEHQLGNGKVMHHVGGREPVWLGGEAGGLRRAEGRVGSVAGLVLGVVGAVGGQWVFGLGWLLGWLYLGTSGTWWTQGGARGRCWGADGLGLWGAVAGSPPSRGLRGVTSPSTRGRKQA